MSELSAAEALMALEALDRAALADRWEAVFGCPAPQRSRALFLREALAWHLQTQAQTEGRASVLQMLRSSRVSRSVTALPPGAELVREWQGRLYRVIVVPGGFECDGKSYRSLTAIARAITGTPWSGPAFFGLRS